MRLWVADGERGLMRLEQEGWRRIGPPGNALCVSDHTVWCAGQERCRCYDGETGSLCRETALPTGVCALAALDQKVYALSSDADSVTAFDAETGSILACAPAGVYPRGLCPHPRRRLLLIAGGASGEMLLLSASLRCLNAYRLPGTVCGACFFGQGMAALCAVETGASLSARLFSVTFRGVTEEVLALPLLPCCLAPNPDGGCVVGCCGEALRIRPNKKTAFRRPVSCPIRLRCFPGGTLACDAGEGVLLLPAGRKLYTGPDPQDSVVL